MSTTLQTRREYLVGLGLAKPGRGKFSNDGKAALAKADAEGYEFLDGPSPTGSPGPVIKSTHPDEQPAPVVAKAGDSVYIMPSDFRFPEVEYTAYIVVEGKKQKVSLRECCNTCRVSLVNHACATPSIHGNMAVTIEKR